MTSAKSTSPVFLPVAKSNGTSGYDLVRLTSVGSAGLMLRRFQSIFSFWRGFHAFPATENSDWLVWFFITTSPSQSLPIFIGHILQDFADCFECYFVHFSKRPFHRCNQFSSGEKQWRPRKMGTHPE